jgi:hypothetical protein
MQLGKLLEEIYVALGLQVLRRVATGGSTTTVIDAGIANRKGDGYYAQGSNGGHILFISQSTDRLAPEGQFGEISAFATSTTTPTFTVPTMTAAAAAGDIYAVMKPSIQLYEMIGRVNAGLRRLPDLELTDVSLTTAANTLAYSLPLPIRFSKILDIQIGNDTDGWEDAPGYDVTPSSGSTVDKLIFTSQPGYDSTTAANKTIKIRYMGKHPTLSVYSDYVEKSVVDELALAVCAEAAYEHLMIKRPAWFNDKTRLGVLSFIQQKKADAMLANPVRVKPADGKQRFNLSEL